MQNTERIVTQTPLTNLWTDKEDVGAVRGRYLTRKDVKDIVKQYPVEFVIADVGLKLKWIAIDKCYDFWKSEVEKHLVDSPEKFHLEDFPNEYAYIASEWVGEIQAPIILLEKYH